MGTNHFSLVAFGATVDETRDTVDRWLRAKGFDHQPGEPLLALDPEHERGVQLRWNDRCVVVLYDHLDEQKRLLFELRRMSRPVLEYWLHDSDVWGYTMWNQGDAVAGFISDRTWLGPGEEVDGPDDLEALCRLAGTGQVEQIRGIRQQKAVFAEEVGLKFVKALGAEAAAAWYGHDDVPAGFHGEHRAYRRANWNPMAGFDLRSVRFRAMPADQDWRSRLSPEDVAAYEAYARRMLWWGWLLRIVTAPIWIPLRLLVWWRMRSMRNRLQDVTAAARAVPETAFRVEGDRVVSDRFGCEITLAPGARVTAAHRHSVQPGAVFGFGAGKLNVFASARFPSALKHLEVVGPPDVRFTDEPLVIGVRPARRVEVQHKEGHVRLLVVVHGPEFVVLFEAMSVGPIDEASRAAFDATVASFRFTRP